MEYAVKLAFFLLFCYVAVPEGTHWYLFLKTMDRLGLCLFVFALRAWIDRG